MSISTEIDTSQLFFKREDFAYDRSWEKYIRGLSLREIDFVDKEKYKQWWLIDLELVDFAIMVISGKKGGGKSLLLSWLGKQLKDHFGKGSTLSYRPKEGYGEYDYLTEQTFIEEWVKLTALADRDNTNEISQQMEQLTRYSKFYNRFIALDEARRWVWKRRPTARLLQYIGELIDLSRHNHLVIAFACPNAEAVVDEITVWNNRTHEVYCGFNTVYRNHATYRIKHINSGKEKILHLSAPENANLWETHNLIAMSRPITKKQMDEAMDQVRYNKDVQKIKERYAQKDGMTVNIETGEIHGE